MASGIADDYDVGACKRLLGAVLKRALTDVRRAEMPELVITLGWLATSGVEVAEELGADASWYDDRLKALCSEFYETWPPLRDGSQD